MLPTDRSADFWPLAWYAVLRAASPGRGGRSRVDLRHCKGAVSSRKPYRRKITPRPSPPRLRERRRRCDLPPSPISGCPHWGLSARRSDSSRKLQRRSTMLSSSSTSATSATQRARCGSGMTGWRCARPSPGPQRTWCRWGTTSTVGPSGGGDTTARCFLPCTPLRCRLSHQR